MLCLRNFTALTERRRSDAGHQQQLQNRSSNGGLAVRNSASGSSLDTRLAAADLAQRLRVHQAKSPNRTPSPARTVSTSVRVSSSVFFSNIDIAASSNIAAAVLTAAEEEERARMLSQEIYMTQVDSWSGAQILQAALEPLTQRSYSLLHRAQHDQKLFYTRPFSRPPCCV